MCVPGDDDEGDIIGVTVAEELDEAGVELHVCKTEDD